MPYCFRYPLIAIYMLYFFWANRVLIAYFSKQHLFIYEQEMANPTRITNILNDIYLAREYGLTEFEEIFMAKLIYIYQSQENLLRWTTETRQNLEKSSIKQE